MRLYKNNKDEILFIGSFPTHGELGGETVKAQQIYNYLVEKELKVQVVDIEKFKKQGIIGYLWFLLYSSFILLRSRYRKIIICKHANTAIPFLFLAKFLNFHKKEIYYIVIGTILYVKNKNSGNMVINLINRAISKVTSKHIKKILSVPKFIYLENNFQRLELINLGLTNVKHLPNCKDPSKPVLISNFSRNLPLNIAFVSRIMEEKGPLILLEALKIVNRNNIVYNVHFYGPIQNEFRERFLSEIENCKNFAFYDGILKLFGKDDFYSYKILSTHDLFVFPTYCDSEGFPGVLIDAMISGLPIIASNLNLNSEIVNPDIGWIFPSKDIDELVRILEFVAKNPEILIQKRMNCLEEAKKYSCRQVLKILYEDLVNGAAI